MEMASSIKYPNPAGKLIGNLLPAYAQYELPPVVPAWTTRHSAL